MKRKILTVLLALVMVVGLLPMAALADEGAVAKVGDAEYTSLPEAIAAADGKTVTLLATVTATVTIESGKTVTLDLNGNDINVTSGCAIVNKGTLTITGSGNVTTSAQGSAAIANFPDATANVNGGTYSSDVWYVIKNMGEMVIDGPVTVKKPDGSTDTSSLIDNGWYGNTDTVAGESVAAQADSAKLTIKNGAFEGKSGAKSCSVVKNDDYGVLEISGGTFDSTNNTGTSSATTILNWNVATISGGTFKGSYPISNGFFNIPADQGILTITGGEFIGTSSLLGQGQGGTPSAAKLSITGGEFTAPMFGAHDYTVEVTGGEFSSGMNPRTYVTEVNTPVAQVEANNETTFVVGGAAIAQAANSGATVTVIKAGEITGLEAGKTINVADGVTGVTVNGNAVEANASYTEPVPVPAYSVKVAAAENGTVTSNRRSATRDQTVTLTVSPADGYALDSLTVTDAKGNEIELTDKGDGKYTFKMPASRVTVTATFKKVPVFTDIDGRWFTEAIEWAAEQGIALDEDGSGLFHPDADCSRAAIVTFLWRAFGSQEPTITECPFTDVSESDSWYKAVLWAYENKITVGYDDPTVFAPDATSERAQTLTFLKRAVKAADVETGNDFTDVPEGSWFEAAVNWGVSKGLTNGYDDPTVFAPREDCSRAEIIAFIYRLLAK